MKNLKPLVRIKTNRSSFKKLNVIAYGYKIIFIRGYFMIVHPSILCRIEFKSLKDAILTCKMNAGTYVQGYIEFNQGIQYNRKPKFKLLTVFNGEH